MNTEDNNEQVCQETRIVIEGQKNVITTQERTLSQAIIIYVFRTIISLALLAALGYGVLNYTPIGDEFKGKYQRAVERTEEALDNNVIVINFLISYWQRPPASVDEINDFNISRVQNPFTIYKTEDGILPIFFPNDGFGQKFIYSVNPEKRIITLRSRGIMGIFGSRVREIQY
ncbi:MAG: hypothetical protein II943_05305 [Victivallales bacterium]|nr:hypothetical protein [Victivallales bacterium]